MEYLWATGTLIHEKNLSSKISCQTPFKRFPALHIVQTNLPQVDFNFTSAFTVKVPIQKQDPQDLEKIIRQFLSHEFANIRRPAQISNWTEWIQRTRPGVEFIDPDPVPTIVRDPDPHTDTYVLGLPDPPPDPLVVSTDPDQDPSLFLKSV